MQYGRFSKNERNCMKRNRLISIVCVASMLACIAGCGKAETIVDYPTANTTVQNTDNNDAGNTTTAEPAKPSDESVQLVTDSLRTNGTFYYNPTILNPEYKDHVSEDLQKEAQAIMSAVYNHDLTIDLSGMKPDKSSVELAADLARLSSPFCELVSFEEDDNGTYRIVYPYEDSVMIEKVAFYEEEVTNMINDRISSTDSDAQRAKIVYKWLVEEFEFDYDSVDVSDGNVEDAPDYEVLDDLTFMQEKHGGVFNFEYTYTLLMFQLGVNGNIMGSMGSYKAQGCDYLDELMQTDKTYFYNLFEIGDSWYYCDPFFEKMVLDEEKENYPDAECEFRYFGMSDETRNKSWDVQYKRPVFSLVASKSPSMPKCEEDLVF